MKLSNSQINHALRATVLIRLAADGLPERGQIGRCYVHQKHGYGGEGDFPSQEPGEAKPFYVIDHKTTRAKHVGNGMRPIRRRKKPLFAWVRVR